MAVFYELSGRLAVRDCAQVHTILAQFDELGGELEAVIEPNDKGGLTVEFSGGIFCSYTTTAQIEDTIRKLGPFTPMPTMLHSICDGEPCEFYIGPAEQRIQAESSHALGEMLNFAGKLTAKDREALLEHMTKIPFPV